MVEDLRNAHTQSTTELREEIQRLKRLLDETQDSVATMVGVISEVRSLSRTSSTTKRLIDALTAQVDSLDGPAILQQVRAIETQADGLTRGLERVTDSMYTPAGEFELLNEQVRVIRDSVSVGTGVQRHGIKFSHPSEIAAILRACHGKGAVAIFHDAVSLLHSIGAASTSHRSTLATMKAQRDVKLSSDLEARVVTSFRTNLPAILYGGASSVETVDEYVSLISKLKSYQDWHQADGVSGVSQRILHGSIEIQERVSFLANQMTTDNMLLRLSNGTLADSVNFVQRLVSFIDATYLELQQNSYFSEKQVWELLVSFIEQIFADLRKARCIIQDASEMDSAVLLWGILKSHEVMDEYIAHSFKKHPSLNGILVQKMLKASPAATINTRIAATEKIASGSTSVINGLKSRLAAVETKTAKL